MDIQGLVGVTVTNVGDCEDKSAISVTATAQVVEITTGYDTLELRNVGSYTVYYGGTSVTAATGFPIYKREWRSWNNIKSGFKVYVVCSNGQTSELRRIEYET